MPGSGKSTWCKKHLTKNDLYISRDEIRYSIISENDEYFSKEKDVFNEFCKRINNGLNQGKDVYADATHLNERSRNKLLTQLKEIPNKIHIIYIKVSLETALERNNNRKGREKVPEDVIKNMYKSLHIDLNNKQINEIHIINND